MASVQHVSTETSLLLLSNGWKHKFFCVWSLFKLHPVLVGWTCCNAVALLLLEMAESPEEGWGTCSRLDPHYPQLDVTYYMKSWLFCVIPAGSFQAKTALGDRLMDMNKHLLFCSADTFYYQRRTTLLPEVQVPKNSNYSNYAFFFAHLKLSSNFRGGCWQCKCMCLEVSLNQSYQRKPLHRRHTGIWKWWLRSTAADWFCKSRSEVVLYIVLTSHLDRKLWG